MAQAEQTADKLLAPEGDLQKHKQAVQQLASQAIQTTANLDALKKEQKALNQLREDLRLAQVMVKDSGERTASLKGDFDKLCAVATQLQGEHSRMKDGLRATGEDTAATTEAVRDVEKKLGPLAELNELGKTTEERLATLNSLAEHVMQKVKVLENQKHTVEHAVVESNRLGEMVWNMDVQIQKLNEGSKQAAQADEALNRIEEVSADIAGQLEQAERMKASFSQDLAKLEKDRTALTEFVNRHFERLALDRKAFESFDQRVQTLQDTLGNLERSYDTLTTKDKTVTAVSRRADELSKQLTALSGQAEALQWPQEALGAMHDRLNQVEELGKDVARQQDTLLRGRQQLEVLRKESGWRN